MQELGKRMEHSALPVRIVNYKYLLFSSKSQTLEHGMAMPFSRNGKMQQCINNTTDTVLVYLGVRSLKAVKSQITDRKSFRDSFSSLVRQL